LRLISGKTMFRAYLRLITSQSRIVATAVVLSILFAAAAALLHPVAIGLISAPVLLVLGLGAYRLSHSAAPLDYPMVDRFFQQVPCYLSIQDRHLHIVRTNELFRRDFGDQIGKRCYTAYKGADEACPDCPVLRVFEDGKTHHSEETVVTADGETAQMLVYATPIPDASGKVIGVMEMSTNITDLKRMQDEIAISQQEYHTLFESVPCFISVQDKDLRIIRVNSVFRKEFGNREGEYCYKVYKNRNAPCTNCPVQRTFDDGEIHSREETVIRRYGSEMEIIVYSAPLLHKDGHIETVMEMATDISEVKKLQQELTLMGRTIAVMVHRIKNILMGLEGGIFVVNTGLEEDNQTDFKRGWGMIERNVDKISRIVKDLLYCSKDRQMEFEQLDPATVVRNVHELFSGRAAQKQIDLRMELPQSLPQGHFDPDALHSLLTNLVTNAFEACINDPTEGKEGHEVILRGRWEEPGKHVFEVEDDGAGIPGLDGESVFEEFFSTKGREGTGLGLLVAHKVATGHGGTITFHSAAGQGTVFRAIIPTVDL